jgi:tRNA nucleotidyltransferase (CCA-adding enzyme)
MTRNVVFARRSATVEELRHLMVETNVGRLPIVSDEGYGRAERDGIVLVGDVLGIATRTDVLAAYQGGWADETESQEPEVTRIDALLDLPYFGRLFRAASAISDDFAGVYLVGGFVRDLLLGRPNYDVDIAVEGDGIQFARRLAQRLGGRVRPHQKFQTAVVLLPPDALGERPAWLPSGQDPFHIDVATTRTEFYDYPAALPSVEHASARQDLFRRDFTINAMAISLKGEDLGEVLDFFGGFRDLHNGVIRVLHNLSFIEDPTRIFRAVRYENRYGFRMDEQTRALAKACVEMRLVGDLSSARLRDELVSLLDEADVAWTLQRLFELGVARQVHPKLATGERTVDLIQRLDVLVREFGLEGDVVRWRLRLAAVTRNMTHDELFMWLERLRLRHADAHVVRKSVVLGPRMDEQLAAGDLGDWDLYHLLDAAPVESVVFASGYSESVAAKERFGRYLGVLRRRHLQITGADVIALGARQGPGVGKVLEAVRRARIEDRIGPGRPAELTAAQAYLEADNARRVEETR